MLAIFINSRYITLPRDEVFLKSFAQLRAKMAWLVGVSCAGSFNHHQSFGSRWGTFPTECPAVLGAAAMEALGHCNEKRGNDAFSKAVRLIFSEFNL